MKHFNIDHRLERIYKRSFRRGRSSVACFLDTAAASALVFAVIYLCISARMQNGQVRMLVSLICTLFYVLIRIAIRSISLDRHVQKLRSNTADNIRRIKLMQDYDGVCAVLKGRGFITAPNIDTVTAADVLLAYSAAQDAVIGLGEPTPCAKELMGYYGIKVISPLQVIDEAEAGGYSASESEVDLALIKSFEDHKDRKKDKQPLLTLLSKNRSIRYIGVGVVLFTLSFVVRYAMYYRILSAAAVSLGSLAFELDLMKKAASKIE